MSICSLIAINFLFEDFQADELKKEMVAALDKISVTGTEITTKDAALLINLQIWQDSFIHYSGCWELKSLLKYLWDGKLLH